MNISTYWQDKVASRRYAFETITEQATSDLDGAKPSDAIKIANAIIDAAEALIVAEKKMAEEA